MVDPIDETIYFIESMQGTITEAYYTSRNLFSIIKLQWNSQKIRSRTDTDVPPIIAFAQREPQACQALMQSLPPNDQAKFQELVQRAETRRAELAEEKRLEEEEAAKKLRK